MDLDKRSTIEFIESEGLSPEGFDILATIDRFHGEMLDGLTPTGSSIPMLPSHIQYLSREKLTETPIAVIDAGGSNLRVALVTFRSGEAPEIEGFSSHRMPGTDGEVGCQEFFDLIAEYSAPVLERSDYLGFCFSYPALQEGCHDGVVQNWTKEVKAPEVVGHSLADGLHKSLVARGVKQPENMVILNDAVATLLSGATREGGVDRNGRGNIGFVFGTGLNCSYWEHNEKITKLSGLDPGGAQPINMESANFAHPPHSAIDEAFWAATGNPELNRFEKMASGGYLGRLVHFVLSSDGGLKLLSRPAGEGVINLPGLTTSELDRFLRDPAGENPLACALSKGSGGDTTVALTVAGSLLERAAKCVAMNLAAIVLWNSDSGTTSDNPITISMDGSTYYKLKGFRERVEWHLADTLSRDSARYYEIVQIENAPIVGAAVAAGIAR